MRTPPDIHAQHTVESVEIARLRAALHSVLLGLQAARDWEDMRHRVKLAIREAEEALGPAGPMAAIQYPPLTSTELKLIRDRCFKQSALPYSAAQDALRLCSEVDRLRLLVPAEAREPALAQAWLAKRK